MKNVMITVSNVNAVASRSIYVAISNDRDMQKLVKASKKVSEKYPYGVQLQEKMTTLENAYTLEQALVWLDEVRLHKVEYVLDKVTVKVINLPDGVTFNPLGYLEVQRVVDWDNPKHEDCLKEIELSKWILETFPTSKFVASRARFALPSQNEEYFNSRNTIKWIFSISASGNKAVEVTKRIYKKVTTTL